MNTLRYKPEYLKQVIDLLTDSPNPVHLPSDIFLEIGRQFESEPDGEKLDKLLRKIYTVMAIEKGELVGLAGMDKEGNIGIFACGNRKAQKLLLGALDRRAEKTETPRLFVQAFDDARDIFLNHGYEPMNEGDDFNLIKKTVLAEKLDIKPENVKRITLDPSKSVIVEGMRSVFPFIFFGMNCFFVFLLVTLSVTKYQNAFAENDTNYIVIFIVFTLMFVAALGIFIGYFVRQARLKKEVLSMRVTNGVIISLSGSVTYEEDDRHQVAYTRVNITYAFYDENNVRREAKFTHRYRFSGPFFYEGQELTVAYSDEKSYILNKYTIVSGNDEEEKPDGSSDLPEAVSEKILYEYVPIKAAKIYFGFALSYLFGFAIVLVFFLTMGIVSANYTGRSIFGEILEKLLFGLPFFAILGGCAIYSISVTIAEKRKYKRLLASPDVRCAPGKIVHADKAFKSSNKMRFLCKFDDGKGKRSETVPSRVASRLVRTGKTSALVVFDKTDAVVLVKRGVYPDVFSFGY